MEIVPRTTLSIYGQLLSRWAEGGYKSVKAIRDIVIEIRRIHRHVPGTHPIRILHLIETSGPGGAERILLDLARHPGSGYNSIIGLLKPGWLRSKVISSGIPCAIVTGDGLGDLGVIAHLLRVVREHQPQLIHAHEFYMNVLGAAVSTLTGIPLVATVHGKNYYPENRRRRLIYRIVTAKAAGVVAVSEDLRQFFCQTTGTPTNRVRVIDNGIDTRPLSDAKRDPKLLESLGISPKASIIGTLGNLYPVKGHIYLIRALQTVLQRRPETHVIILGRGKLKEALIAEAKALGIKDRIHLLGFRDDASSWLGTMDLFTLPSLSEGLPLSLLEAMAAGIPVIVTTVGGMPGVVSDGQTGFLVPPRDSNALARKILFVLENSATAANIGATARRHIHERYSLERMVTKYHALYQKALLNADP